MYPIRVYWRLAESAIRTGGRSAMMPNSREMVFSKIQLSADAVGKLTETETSRGSLEGVLQSSSTQDLVRRGGLSCQIPRPTGPDNVAAGAIPWPRSPAFTVI
jgi:hypothetical protein